jgi:phosphatidylserine/phosphatidylglycerophosphate/cardiolipin synthase-like enzyme
VGGRFRSLVVQLREAHPEEYRRGMGYFLVGSSNQDYRSMLMDGEVGVALSGLAAVNGLWDSMGLAAGATYPATVEELDEYLPYYTGLKWKMSRWIKVVL